MSGNKQKRAPTQETEGNASPDKRKMKKLKTEHTDAAHKDSKKGEAKSGAAKKGGEKKPEAKGGAAPAGAAAAGKKKDKSKKPNAPAAAPKEEEEDEQEAGGDVDTDALQAIDKLQADMDEVDANLQYETLILERKFNQKKAPLYAARTKAIARIPHFWVIVMMQKEELREVMTDVDVDMLKHLISFEVTDLDAPKVGYTLKFTFEPNEFMSNTVLEKSYECLKVDAAARAQSAADNELGRPDTWKVSATDIQWKDAKFEEKNENSFFLQYFHKDVVEQDTYEDSIAETLRNEVWKNPLSLYLDSLDEGEGEDEFESGLIAGENDDDDEAEAAGDD